MNQSAICNPQSAILVISMSAWLFVLVCGSDAAQERGRDGFTFKERADRFIETLANPDASMDIEKAKLYFPVWLEKVDRGLLQWHPKMTEALQHITGDWWTKKAGQFSHHPWVVYALLKYPDLIPADLQERMRRKWSGWLRSSGMWGGLNPQKQMNIIVGMYLWAKYFEQGITTPKYGCPKLSCDTGNWEKIWPSFTWKGRRYENDGVAHDYNALILARDFIEWRLDGWYVQKIDPGNQREFDSYNYTGGFYWSMALLRASLDLMNDKDDPLYEKSYMAFMLVMLDYVMDHGNSNGLSGTVGRGHYQYTWQNAVFAIPAYWGMSKNVERFQTLAPYTLDLELPDILVDIGVMTDETDEFWWFETEHNPNSLFHGSDGGKWEYCTKYFCMGSSTGTNHQGWQAVINAEENLKGDKAIRLWINDLKSEQFGQQGNYLGSHGRQFRNAMFAAVGKEPWYWEQFVDGAAWDGKERVGETYFRTEGKVMLSFTIGALSAGLEIEIIGLNYRDVAEFKSAVLQKSLLTDDSYTTSRGWLISKDDYAGMNQPGDVRFPTKRLEAWLSDGSQSISWQDNVMTVTFKERRLVCDFNNWTWREDGGVLTRPRPPQGVSVKAK